MLFFELEDKVYRQKHPKNYHKLNMVKNLIENTILVHLENANISIFSCYC